MGGQNPQDMMKRGMPMLGQVPGAVKKGPLGQLHKDTSELIQSTQKDQSQQQIDSVITPDEQSFIDAQKTEGVPTFSKTEVDEQLAQEYKQNKYKQENDEFFQEYDINEVLDETITDKEFLLQKITETVDPPFSESPAFYGLSTDSPLIHLQNKYRHMMILKYKKHLDQIKEPDNIKIDKWKKMSLADLEDDLLKSVSHHLGYTPVPPVTSPPPPSIAKGDTTDPVFLIQQLKKLKPKQFGTVDENQHTWSLDSLQTQYRNELIAELDDYWSGTKYPGDKNYFDDLPLDELMAEYDSMVFDQSELGGGELKTASKHSYEPSLHKMKDKFTNPIDKPEEINPVRKFVQSQRDRGSKLLEAGRGLNILKQLKKLRMVIKNRKAAQSKEIVEQELAIAEAARKQRRDEKKFDPEDRQVTITGSWPVYETEIKTMAELEEDAKKRGPDAAWDDDIYPTGPKGLSGPISVPHTEEENRLTKQILNSPLMREILGPDGLTKDHPVRKVLRDIHTHGKRFNRMTGKRRRTTEQRAINELSETQKVYLIEALRQREASGIPESSVDMKDTRISNFIDALAAIRGMATADQREWGRIQEAKERGEDLKYRVPKLTEKGEPVGKWRSPRAFSRYPKVVWKEGRFQAFDHSGRGAVYFGPVEKETSDLEKYPTGKKMIGVKYANAAAQAFGWSTEALDLSEKFRERHGISWDDFTSQYKDMKKGLGDLEFNKINEKNAVKRLKSSMDKLVEVGNKLWLDPKNQEKYGAAWGDQWKKMPTVSKIMKKDPKQRAYYYKQLNFLSGGSEEIANQQLKLMGFDKQTGKYIAKMSPDRAEMVADYESAINVLSSNVVAQMAIFKEPVEGRDPSIPETVIKRKLPDTISVQDYEDFQKMINEFDYKSLGDMVDPDLARRILLTNLELAYMDLSGFSTPARHQMDFILEEEEKLDRTLTPDEVSELKNRKVLTRNKKIKISELNDIKNSTFVDGPLRHMTSLPSWGEFEKKTDKTDEDDNVIGKYHAYQETLLALGFTGSRVSDEAGTSTAMLDMKAIAAPWGKFKKDSADILSAVLAGGLITTAQMKRLQKENRPERRTRERKKQYRNRSKNGKRTRVRVR